MWLPQGGALKIENLQFTQYSTIFNATDSVHDQRPRHRYTQTHTDTCSLTNTQISFFAWIMLSQ